MKDDRKNGKSGETLVEIMVSAFLFLILMAVMQGAISFCTNARHKSEQIRAANAEICQNLHSALTAQDNGSSSFDFRAVSADGNVEGKQVFSVNVEMKRKEASNGDGSKKVTFYLFDSALTGGGRP